MQHDRVKSMKSQFILIIIIYVLCSLIQCSSCSTTDSNRIGLNWEEFAYTTWYIEDGDGLALERWRFYPDSLVADIDHFRIENGQRIVTGRSRQKAFVFEKNMTYEYWVDNKINTYNATELQWKTMWPSLTNPQDWAIVYDWSVYQLWCIEWSSGRTACVGDVPYCYLLQIDVPFNLTYNQGWIYDEMR